MKMRSFERGVFTLAGVALALMAGHHPPPSQPIDGFRDLLWGKDYLNQTDDLKSKFKSYDGTTDLTAYAKGLQSMRFTDTIEEKPAAIELFEYPDDSGNPGLRAAIVDLKVDSPDTDQWIQKNVQLIKDLQDKYGKPSTYDPCSFLQQKNWKFDTFNKSKEYEAAQNYRKGKRVCSTQWNDANGDSVEVLLRHAEPDTSRLTVTYLSKGFKDILDKALAARDKAEHSKL